MRLRTLLAAAIVVCGPAWCAGDPVTLNINGNVKAAPCQVSSDSVTKTVDLNGGKALTAASLYTAGSTTPWVNFDFQIEQCPPGTSQVAIFFNGEPDDSHPQDMYRNQGTASAVAIQVQSVDGQPLGNGQSVAGVIASQGYTWNLRARLYSQQGQAQAGTVNAGVTVTLIYQ